MPTRATKRGAERTPLDRDCDVLICGASFAGLAVARELAGSGADVLVIDRYEIGERQTSACGIPTEWLTALGLQDCDAADVRRARASTPPTPPCATTCRGRSRPSTTARCAALLADAGHVHVRDRQGASGATATSCVTDRGTIRAPLIVDALGWRRVLGAGANVQPPDALLSRGLEVHPVRRRRGPGGVDRPLLRPRRLRLELPGRRGAADRRRLVRPPVPRPRADRPAGRGPAAPTRVRYQGNWIPHALRPATEDGVFFVGDSAGHCLPLTAEGIRTALYFGLACGRELRARRRRRADPRRRPWPATTSSRPATRGRFAGCCASSGWCRGSPRGCWPRRCGRWAPSGSSTGRSATTWTSRTRRSSAPASSRHGRRARRVGSPPDASALAPTSDGLCTMA